MKKLTIIFLFSIGYAIEILHQDVPEKLLFKTVGKVIKVESYKLLKYHIDLTKYTETDQIFKNQSSKITKICEKSSWSLFEVCPLIFKEGKELNEITSVTDFILRLNQTTYALMSQTELDSCYQLKTKTYLCSFEPIDKQMITCEGSTLLNRETGFCRHVTSIKRTKVIQTENRAFYINN